MGGPNTWMSAGSGGSAKKSMHAMNYGKQQRCCSFCSVARFPSMSSVCLLFILAQALGKAHRRIQPKYNNLPEQMRLVAGLEIGG